MGSFVSKISKLYCSHKSQQKFLKPVRKFLFNNHPKIFGGFLKLWEFAFYLSFFVFLNMRQKVVKISKRYSNATITRSSKFSRISSNGPHQNNVRYLIILILLYYGSRTREIEIRPSVLPSSIARVTTIFELSRLFLHNSGLNMLLSLLSTRVSRTMGFVWRPSQGTFRNSLVEKESWL